MINIVCGLLIWSVDRLDWCNSIVDLFIYWDMNTLVHISAGSWFYERCVVMLRVVSHLVTNRVVRIFRMKCLGMGPGASCLIKCYCVVGHG